MTLADLDPVTACDLAYAQLAEWADRMDDTLRLAQLINGTEEIEPHPHRDDLDSQLGAPIGREAVAMANLTKYLKG